MSTTTYRVDSGGDGSIGVWNNFSSEYVLRLAPPASLVVAAMFRNLERTDPRRADDFMFGYQLAMTHQIHGVTIETSSEIH